MIHRTRVPQKLLNETRPQAGQPHSGQPAQHTDSSSALEQREIQLMGIHLHAAAQFGEMLVVCREQNSQRCPLESHYWVRSLNAAKA